MITASILRAMPEEKDSLSRPINCNMSCHTINIDYSLDITSLLASIYTSDVVMSVNSANQTNDILRYPMINVFIVYVRGCDISYGIT